MSRFRSIPLRGALALLGATLATTGCDVDRRVNAMRTALEAAPVCCSGPREFSFEPAAREQRYAFTIGESSPAFPFPTGKSYFKGFALPATPRPMTATIVSHAVAEKASLNKWTGHYFSPIVVFYDENLKPSRPVEGTGRFLFDGQGRRFSVHQVPVAPDARFMDIRTNPSLMGATIAVPVEFAAQGTHVLTCGTAREGTFGGQADLEPMARALCGLFAGAPVYAPSAASDWNASIPYATGGELELWLSAPPPAKAPLAPTR